jgi:endonuclease YncB( thermonuclease family)
MNVVRKVLLPGLILIFAIFFASHTQAGEYQVNRVIDGDTIEVKKGSVKLTVRLVGIDAPEVSHKKHEPGQPFSQQSTKYLAKLAQNRSVDVKSYGADRYGRVLGEVFADGNNANLEMVKAGMAEVYRGNPAQGQDLGQYWKAEEDARKAGKGMWVLGDKYLSPREWRKTHQN